MLAAPGAAYAPLDEFERLLDLLADNPSLFGVDFEVGKAVSARVRNRMACDTRSTTRSTRQTAASSSSRPCMGSRDAARVKTRCLWVAGGACLPVGLYHLTSFYGCRSCQPRK